MSAPIPPQKPRYESLDAWRGIACLSVVAFHSIGGYIVTPQIVADLRANGGPPSAWIAAAISYLWIGVPVFFVISGYCIAASADVSRGKPHPGAMFFWRRFRRIYPPLWAYLALAALFVAILPPAYLPGPSYNSARPLPRPDDMAFAQWIGSVTLTEEWRHYFWGPPKDYFTGQLWTLCYEEQFYFVMGFIVMISRRWLFPLAAVVTLLVFLNVADLNGLVGSRIGVDLNSYQAGYMGFFFDGLWLAFAAGIGVYYRTVHATPAGRRYIDILLIGGVVIMGQGLTSPWDLHHDLKGFIVVSFSAALALAWLHPWDGHLATARATAPLRWAGKMCYSLYLVHAPITLVVQANLYRLGITSPLPALLVTLPLAMSASLAVAWLFHRSIEQRFLNSPTSPSPAKQA